MHGDIYFWLSTARSESRKNNKLAENTFKQGIEYLYQALSDSAAWTPFFQTFSKLLTCVDGQYLIFDQAGEVIFSTSHASEQISQRSSHTWFCHNLFSLLGNRADKRSLFQYDLSEGSTLNKQFCKETGLRHITICRTFDHSLSLSIMVWFRRSDQPAMRKADLQWLQRLLPEFERASRLNMEMIRLKETAAWRERVLDRFDYPIFLVNVDGQIHFSNRAAEIWQSDSRLFRFRSQSLIGRTKDNQTILDRILKRAIMEHQCAIYAFARQDGGKPYQMMALPLDCSANTKLLSNALALIVVGDPLANTNLTMNGLRSMFGFSHAEARVTIGLLEGKTLEEIALEGGVSINTIRSQLRQALEKTGSCRQTELLRTVTALPRLRN